MRKINISEAEGNLALCFDTSLDARSFARTKLAQCITDPGFIVFPDGASKIWKASGVMEEGNTMKIYGPVFTGERLDALMDSSESNARDKALQAIIIWIRAKLALGEVLSSNNPGAAFIAGFEETETENPKGSIFFAPETVSERCLFAEGLSINRFNCPDLQRMEAAAYCAGTLLYEVMTGARLFTVSDHIHQDMREGNYVPASLINPGLDEKIIELIETALSLPISKKKTTESGTAILNNILNSLTAKGEEALVSSFARSLTEEEVARCAKEKGRYMKKKNVSLKANRFLLRNKPVLIGVLAGLVFITFVTVSMIKSRTGQPTTAGLSSQNVIVSYYEALSSLNHTFMEECILGADKSDVDMVINYFVVNKVKQAHERDFQASIIPARVWKDNGGELPAPNVFGVTDLSVEHMSGSERDISISYRINYTLWFPIEPFSSVRSDQMTLTKKRGNWRITTIRRTILEE